MRERIRETCRARGRVPALRRALQLQGCATGGSRGPSPSETFAQGQQQIAQGRVEEGLALVEQAARHDPKRIEYQVYLANQREAITAALAREADRYRAAGDYATAEAIYQQILRMDPGSQRARTGLAQIPVDQRHDLLIAQAEAAVAKGDSVTADGLMRQVLQENPQNPRARALSRRIEEDGVATTGASPRLKRSLKKPITLEFRDADLSAVFEVMSRAAGINFVLDREVQGDAKVNIFVRNSPIEDVLKILLLTNQLEHKVLNDNSVLVFPSTPAKQREYQDLAVRSFYLTNADAKQTQAMLKAVIKSKDIYIDEKLNLLVLRDTPEAIRVAEKLVAAQDLAEPEVVLDLEVLEVQRARLQAARTQVSERDPVRPGSDSCHRSRGRHGSVADPARQRRPAGLRHEPGHHREAQAGAQQRQPARQSAGARQEPREGEGADRPQAPRVHHHLDRERRRVHQCELSGRGAQARDRAAGLSRRRSLDEGEPGSEQRHPGAQQRRHAAGPRLRDRHAQREHRPAAQGRRNPGFGRPDPGRGPSHLTTTCRGSRTFR